MKVSKYIKFFELDQDTDIIMNSVTGAIDMVNHDISSILKNQNEINADIPFYESLKARGYIIDNNDDQKQLEKLVNRQISTAMGVFIICPTFLCNLRCPYCFEGLDIRKESKVLEKKDVDKIFDAIKEIQNLRGFKKIRILLYGGEPFLNITKNIVTYIFDKSEQNDYTIQTITNGTQLHLYEELFRKHLNRISSFQITLDGPEKIHNKLRITANKTGTFEAITNNIDMCINIGIPIALRINTGVENVRYIKEIISLIESRNWHNSKYFSCQFAPITDHFCTSILPNWSPEYQIMEKIINQFDDFEEYRDKYKLLLGSDMEKRIKLLRSLWKCESNFDMMPKAGPCSAAARNYYIFGPDNYIYACPETVGKVEYSIGKYYPEFMIDNEKEKVWSRNVSNIEGCKNCNIAGLCGAGCIWSSVATNGKNFNKAQCNYAQETIDTYFNLNIERIKKISCE